MRLVAVNTRSRIALARLLMKMEDRSGYSKEIGLIDRSQYSAEDGLKKEEVKEC